MGKINLNDSNPPAETGYVNLKWQAVDPATLTDADARDISVEAPLVSDSTPGLMPAVPNDATKFMRGDGAWAELSGVAEIVAFNPANAAQWFDDFLCGISNTQGLIGELGWNYAANGAGGGCFVNYANARVGHPGQVQVTTGSGTYGYANLNLALGLGQDLSATVWTWESLVQVDAMSGGEYYSIGFGQSHNDWNAVSSNLICFRMDKRINGNWQAVCRKSGTETIVDTGVTASAWSWHKLKMVSDGAGTIRFYVGGVLKATINTNVPTVDTIVGPQFFVGYISANNSLMVDYWSFKMTLAR